MPLVTLMPVNTSRREGFRLLAAGCPLGCIPERGRWQKVKFPLSAIRCRLSAWHRHSERSEES